MVSKFSESETESYYDAEDVIYRSVWDEEGSVHWALFDDSTGKDFLKGCENLNRTMVSKGRINQDSKVLDLGLRQRDHRHLAGRTDRRTCHRHRP